MIFAHLDEQISASIETCPYSFMGEETIHIFAIINPFAGKNKVDWWADTPWFHNLLLDKPSKSICYGFDVDRLKE